MSRTCTICSHDERHEIERSLVARIPYRHIASRFAVSTAALQRHLKDHLPATLALAHEAEEVARADGLLEEVRALQGRTMTLLDRAEKAGDLHVALRAIREARGNLALLGTLAGELQVPGTAPVVSIVASPEWVEVRTAVVQALEPHPAARESVLTALEGVGSG